MQMLGVERGYLTHLSMHYDKPITLAKLEARLEPYQGAIVVACDGMRLSLSV
jgi:hypothetical protein